MFQNTVNPVFPQMPNSAKLASMETITSAQTYLRHAVKKLVMVIGRDQQLAAGEEIGGRGRKSCGFPLAQDFAEIPRMVQQHLFRDAARLPVMYSLSSRRLWKV
ncbi:MAG TPA: hypothetical protein VK149_12140 [Sideroxyarcus sp.]|nr:hypothetical protein [Sideroxyarcus sp.]